MPPRLFVAVVVAGWLATIGWLAHDKWLPWLRPSDEPAFRVELADEVAPEYASWTVHRNGKKAGSAETKVTPHKDGSFELSSRLRDTDFNVSFFQIKLPTFATTRTVRRDGELVNMTCKAVLVVRSLGPDVRIETEVRGHVEGDLLVGDCEYDYGAGKMTAPLEPIKLVSKNAFSPLQPLQKYPALRPGQTWRASNVDPVSDALHGAMERVVAGLTGTKVTLPAVKRPTEFLARVQPDMEEITHKEKTYTCRVILFEAEGVKARTWVDFRDGRVIRQEATMFGDMMVLQRE
jgi:hypothetical protein